MSISTLLCLKYINMNTEKESCGGKLYVVVRWHSFTEEQEQQEQKRQCTWKLPHDLITVEI